MSAPSLCQTALLGAAVLGTWCSFCAAQQSGARPRPSTRPPAAKQPASQADPNVRPTSGTEATPRPQRPQPPELKIEPLPPALEKLLKEWEVASTKVKTLSGEHERIVYNAVFEVEKQARGQFYYEAPDKGRIDIEAYPVKPNQKAKRSNPKTANPYRVEADQPSKWICTGKEVLNINEEEKTVEAFPLPEDLQGKNIIHGPLPFLFGMKADEAKRRFELSFTDPENPNRNNEQVAWITARPRQNMDKENFQEATIILDRRRYLPTAVRLIDPSGNVETVYSFKEIHVNRRELIPELFRKDPFEPNLKGYKLILPPTVHADQKTEGGFGEGRAGVRQAGNAAPASSGEKGGPSRTATTSGGTIRPQKSSK